MKRPSDFLFWFFVGLSFFLALNYTQVEAQDKVVQPDIRPALQQLDIALVLDNSGSMQENDPQFLTKEVVTNFMVGFEAKARLAMVIFDQEARLVQPLTDLTGLVARANFLKSIDQVNYKGLFSDSPAAIERAMYELKINGRINAPKVIILLTDGILDTGDKMRDLEKTKWLKENLTQECRNAGIKIFGIAFTDNADFSLIQTLAFKTKGEYFRAYSAEDIQKVFDKISQLISKLPSGASTKISTPTPPAAIFAPSTGRAVTPGLPAPTPDSSEGFQKIPAQVKKPVPFMLIVVIGILVLLAVIILILALNRKAKTSTNAVGVRSRSFRRSPPMPRAELIDVKDVTSFKTLKLSSSLVKIGRDTSNDVVIPKETVSSFHAAIEYRDGFFYLEDQRSKNKTYLNGEEVVPYSPKKIKSGDVITINVYKFIFILPDLIPAGETVIDFSGKAERQSEGFTAVRGQAISGQDSLAMPQALMIDVKNITGKKTLLLSKQAIEIGRGVHNDIAIDQNSISGSHAVIRYKDGFFRLEDQRSKNKTFLNGEEIAPHTQMKLKSGDEILFDIYKFIFLLEQHTPSGDTDENW